MLKALKIAGLVFAGIDIAAIVSMLIFRKPMEKKLEALKERYDATSVEELLKKMKTEIEVGHQIDWKEITDELENGVAF